MNTLDWTEITQQIQNFCTSFYAKEKVKSLTSFKTKPEAEFELYQVLEAAKLLAHQPRPYMESLDIFDPWFSRLKKKATLKTLEIKDARMFFYENIALFEVLQSYSSEWTKKKISELISLEEPLSAIDQILSPNGEIRSDASEKLYQLIKEKELLSRQISQNLDKLVHAHEMESHLQDKFVTTREGRWVLPVKSGKQHSVTGLIHGSSQTKQTVFIEPEVVVPLNNRLRQIELEIEDEIERILHELSKYLYTKHNDFNNNFEILKVLDEVFAKAQFSLKIKSQAFIFDNEDYSLKNLKHPLLVLSQPENYDLIVGNNIKIDPKKSIHIFSGPNAGGKTVLLKSIGLAAKMASCGLPICAQENSKIPFFENIVAIIGDSQNVEQNLSTFAAHLHLLKSTTALNGPNNLVLIDEICGATDPDEGSALSRAFIETYAENKVYAVITSHLGPLKLGWESWPQVENSSLDFDAKTGKPTYRLLTGVPGESQAIVTAERLGIDKKIIHKALHFLQPEIRSRLNKQKELDEIKENLSKIQKELQKELQETKQKSTQLEKEKQKLEQEKNSILEKEQKKAESKISELISQALAEQTFNKHRKLQDLKVELPQIINANSLKTTNSEISSAELFFEKYPLGSKVFIKTLGQDGIIQSSPNPKGELMVLSNSMRMNIHWSQLGISNQNKNPTTEIIRKHSNHIISALDQDRTLDVRGKTVNESLEELERLLDHCATANEDRIKIIHGHGTDTLKKAIRSFLSRSVYIKKWKAGSPEHGGDGVTWAELSKD